MSSDLNTTHVTITEEKSCSEMALERYASQTALAEQLELAEDDFNSLECFLPKQLEGCIFVGHKATDLDSIASAIGCAELYRGIAARASDVNNETLTALNLWGLPMPDPFITVKENNVEKMVCIVDHNQAKQCPDGLEMDMLLGCIDHHAMQGGTISTSAPIYVNIQPWGSACTIVAHMFFRARRKVSLSVAGMLLSGILSDTLNLRSPTTTEHDCLAVSLLAKLAQVPDINVLARTLFKAKSQEMLRCTPHQLVSGDLKTFECRSNMGNIISMAFGVIETTDPTSLLNIKDQQLLELRALKKEEGKDLAYLGIVDIVNMETYLLLVGSSETALAAEVFQGSMMGENVMNLGNRVSRKKQFIPPIEKCLSKGWKFPEMSVEEKQANDTEEFGQVQLECGDYGCQLVRHPPKFEKGISATGLTRKLYHALNRMNYGEVEKAVAFALGDTSMNTIDNTKLKRKCCDHLPSPTLTRIATADDDDDIMIQDAFSEEEDNIKKAKLEQHLRSPSVIKSQLSSNTHSPHVKPPPTPRMHHLQVSSLQNSEESIAALLDTEEMVNASTTINNRFVLPTKQQFDTCLKNIANGNDVALKFLVLALAHSFEVEGLMEEEIPQLDV